jgi:hypothetical protein
MAEYKQFYNERYTSFSSLYFLNLFQQTRTIRRSNEIDPFDQVIFGISG